MNGSPIRILQYIGSLNTGGSQSMIMNIYRNIDKNKIQFDFIVDRKDELLYKNEIESLGGKVFIFEEYLDGKNIITYKKQWNDFFNLHNEYKIIHCHVRSVASIVLKIAKKNGLITICHSHSTSNGSGFKSIIKRLLQKRIKRYCDYYFACSKSSSEWLFGKNIAKSNNCYIINNAIDTKKFIYNENVRNNVRKNFKLEEKKVIGQVGRMVEVKNYDFSIKLLKKLVEKNEKYHLLIIGSGPLKEKIVSIITDYNLSNNVTFLENRNDVNELLQAVDVYIMPSLWEGLPLSLVEAQAASLPCVISTNVLDGIIIDDLVTKIDINDIGKWLDCIESNIKEKKNRINQYNNVVKSGFDIAENVKIITDFYFNL